MSEIFILFLSFLSSKLFEFQGKILRKFFFFFRMNERSQRPCSLHQKKKANSIGSDQLVRWWPSYEQRRVPLSASGIFVNIQMCGNRWKLWIVQRIELVSDWIWLDFFLVVSLEIMTLDRNVTGVWPQMDPFVRHFLKLNFNSFKFFAEI